MRKITVRKIYIYAMSKLARIQWLDDFLLRINDVHNNVLKSLLKRSFETRVSLYGEGGGEAL